MLKQLAGSSGVTRLSARASRMVFMVVWLLAQAIDPSAASAADGPCGNQPCSADTKHNLSWLNLTNAAGTRDWISDVSEGALPGLAVTACEGYAKAHSNGGQTMSFSRCVPKLPIPYIEAGGASASISVEGDYRIVRDSDGGILSQGTSIWSLLAGGCADAYNPNGALFGTNGQCYCAKGKQWLANPGACVSVIEIQKPLICTPGVGNPIAPLTGAKIQREMLGISIGQESISLAYHTAAAIPYSIPPTPINGIVGVAAAPPSAFGGLWTTSLHKGLYIQRKAVGSATSFVVHAFRGDGNFLSFIHPTNTTYLATHPTVKDRMEPVLDGTGNPTSQVRLIDRAGNVEVYELGNLASSTTGDLISVAYISGGGLNYAYSTPATATTTAPYPGLLVSVADQQGRSVNFRYEPSGASFAARLKQVEGPEGQVTSFGYTAAGHLAQITWPDGKLRKFLYERADIPWALSGIVDENASRLSTYTYDSVGRAIATEYADGVGRYVVSYETPPLRTLTETWEGSVLTRIHGWDLPRGTRVEMPNGMNSALTTQDVGGLPFLIGQTQPAGSGCSASSNAIEYDGNGDVASRVDFQGSKTCYTYAAGREVERIEGLPSDAVCTGAVPAGARKITTQWHPDWPLPVVITEAMRKTTLSYHNASNTNCTTANPMPNGKPLPLLCSRVEQALVTGNPDPSVAPKVASYTYDAAGRMLTSVDPKLRTTVFSYYSDTVFSGIDPDAIGHAVGDLQSSANAAGHTTTFTSYDKAGRLRQSVDPRGVSTDITYTPRGWVDSVTVTASGASPRVARYEYDNVGQRTAVRLPDGTSLSYEYDAAHRLIAITDARGNAIAYSLDASGNRTAEDLRDPSGVLKRTTMRSYDALDRVQQVTSGLVSGRVGSAISISASPNPATTNSPVNIAVQVTGNSPTGTVSFYDGPTLLGTAPVNGGASSISHSFSLNGSKELNATYSGDALNTLIVSSTLTLPVISVTSVSLSALPSPVSVGTPVSLTAQVTGGLPAGTVTFWSGTTVLGTALLGNGAASFSSTFTGAGSKSLSAAYGGDAKNAPSTSPAVSLIVSKGATTTTLSVSPSSGQVYSAVTMTAQVTGTSPTGNAIFNDGATVLGTAPVNNGSATLSYAFIAGGTKVLTASYGGDANNNASTSSSQNLTVVDSRAASTTTFTCRDMPNSETVVNLFVYCTVMVTPKATGIVEIVEGTRVLGTTTLSGSPYDESSAAIGFFKITVGTHSFQARYVGDSTKKPSQSAPLTFTVLDKVAPVMAFSCPTSAQPFVSFTCTATLTTTHPGIFTGGPGIVSSGQPTFYYSGGPPSSGGDVNRGSLRLWKNGSSLGSQLYGVAVNSDRMSGVANMSVADGLPAGTHQLKAVFAEGESLAPSESAIVNVVIP